MNKNSTGGSHPSTLHRRETSVPLHMGLQKWLGFKLRVPEESSEWAKYLKAKSEGSSLGSESMGSEQD